MSKKLILLVDVDCINPNLALMKLSAYYKQEGYKVVLIKVDQGLIKLDLYKNPHKIFVSCVFTSNAHITETIRKRYKNVTVGGSGVDFTTLLPEKIEHTCPDYDLYEYREIYYFQKEAYSMGFTSRGCIRKCGFCIVREKEGYIKEHADLSEFVKHRFVMLYDNNFLASPKWKTKIKYMIANKLTVDFNQGLDLRLIAQDKSKAEWLTKLNPPFVRFAWDLLDSEKLVLKGIQNLKDAGYNICRRKVGMLMVIGYNTTIEEDLYRVETLHKLDIHTYCQPYRDPTKAYTPVSDECKALIQWANSPRNWVHSEFKDFKNEQYRETERQKRVVKKKDELKSKFDITKFI